MKSAFSRQFKNHRFQFCDFLVLLGKSGLQIFIFLKLQILCFHLLLQGHDFPGHNGTGTHDGISMAQADADACIDHVFSAAPAAGQGEEGTFIGLVEGADGISIGIHVVTETGSKVPLFFRIEIQRTKRRQSSCPGANPGQAIVKPVHSSIHTADQTFQLAHVHRIGITGPRCHIVDLLAAHGDIAVCDFHSMGIVAVSGNLDAAAGDGRTGFAFSVIDGQAVVVQSTIARGDAGKSFELAGQLDIQTVASGVLDHTDVAICQLGRIRTAGQFHGFAQASGDGFSIIPGKVPAAQLADFRLGSLTGKGLHIADIGRVRIIAVNSVALIIFPVALLATFVIC